MIVSLGMGMRMGKEKAPRHRRHRDVCIHLVWHGLVCIAFICSTRVMRSSKGAQASLAHPRYILTSKRVKDEFFDMPPSNESRFQVVRPPNPR